MNKDSGIFKLALKGLNFQLETLFADCGGEKSVELLDRLSKCSPSMRDKLLNCMLTVTNSVQDNSLDSAPSGEFEDSLYNEICSELEKASQQAHSFEVLEGGASALSNSSRRSSIENIIDFESARRRPQH